MSNTSQKKADKYALREAQNRLVEWGKDSGKLTTEQIMAVLEPLEPNMDQIASTFNTLTEAGIEVPTVSAEATEAVNEEEVAPSAEELTQLEEEIDSAELAA